MKPFLWDGYTITEVNEKIRYWVDVWETLIDERDDLLSGLDLSNPHLVVREIADEIEGLKGDDLDITIGPDTPSGFSTPSRSRGKTRTPDAVSFSDPSSTGG